MPSDEPRRRPLDDVRIIAVEQYGAGPFGTVHLADLGADVIKIEDPRTNGDVGRTIPPFQEGEHSLFFETFNRNKRSISLDVSSTAGREVFEDLVRVSDVVASNLRGDVPKKIRITYEDLKHLNRAIVCASLSGFGMTGPRSTEPGYDYVLQALCGWMSLTGEPDGPPTKSGLSLVDFSGGYVLTGAILAGLHAARRDGIGMDCDLSLYDVAMSMLSYPGTWVLTKDYETPRISRSAHPSIVPFQNLPTKDGWIQVSCPKQKFWERFCEAVERPELLRDVRFVDFDGRRINRAALEPLLDEALSHRTVDEWVEILSDAGVPVAPILSLRQAVADPQCEARELVAETEHPVFGTVRQFVTPLRVGGVPKQHHRAPLRNEHAKEVLGDLLGYNTAKISALADAGAFG